MAPESERATCKHERLNMEGVCPCGYWVGDPTAHLREPTLTCSEVVERLYKECFTREMMGMGGTLARYAGFDREKAEAILHSWRERRVQELEEALRMLIRESEYSRTNSLLPDDRIQELLEWWRKFAAKSIEWREQIRKGAKHE